MKRSDAWPNASKRLRGDDRREVTEISAVPAYIPFLPPYSPELNRIEKLWHKMKYEWMVFKSRDAQTLEADVDEILTGFGEKYTLDFC